jgi:predicted TPR repeat methyltransferase
MKSRRPKPPRRTPDELVALGHEHAERGEHADAEARYREALAVAPDHLGAICLLGFLLVERDDPGGAIDLLERARELAPDFPPVQLALGAAYAAAGHDELAVAAMERAILLDPGTVPLERLAKHHIRENRPREAIGLLRRLLRRDPAHAQAQFLLVGLTGGTADSPPSELIADLFDTYAASFDQHLVDGLQYRTPKLLAALVVESGAPARSSWCVVDLGCGTGLAGVELRAYARTLIGSDLSKRMIARARQRGIYDELHVEDLVATLARARGVDLIVAADVFIYVGALDATFAACAAALHAGAWFAFSIERSDGRDVVLQPTLRYAHGEAYIAGLASTHGFAVARAEPAVIRIDRGNPVDGVHYLLRRS